jgi:hypothetical protein
MRKVPMAHALNTLAPFLAPRLCITQCDHGDPLPCRTMPVSTGLQHCARSHGAHCNERMTPPRGPSHVRSMPRLVLYILPVWCFSLVHGNEHNRTMGVAGRSVQQ